MRCEVKFAITADCHKCYVHGLEDFTSFVLLIFYSSRHKEFWYKNSVCARMWESLEQLSLLEILLRTNFKGENSFVCPNSCFSAAAF
jgi:hypothetical protein